MKLKSGAKVGRWVVISDAGLEHLPNGKRTRMVNCECQCGTRRAVLQTSLLTRKSKSCGCSHVVPIQPRTQIGRWTVLEPIWLSKLKFPICGSICKCECGTVRAVANKALRDGSSMSCGCGQRDAVTTHGLKNSKEYNSWNAMMDRCRNPRSKDWDNYGGRGIKVCKRWNNFVSFLEDMGKRPPHCSSIERKDNNGDYCKSNCKWATSKEQGRNKRTNGAVEVNGKMLCFTAFADSIGMSHDVIHRRVRVLRMRKIPISADTIINSFKRYTLHG